MSSKRRLRRKACEGKARHASREAAMIEIRHAGKPGLGAYLCQHCHGWHIGHSKGTRYLITSHLNAALLADGYD